MSYNYYIPFYLDTHFFMSKKLFLSVIIPCYNEEENLKKEVLREVHDFLKKKKFLFEVIISDDGSSDNSLNLVKKQIKNFKNFRLIKNRHGGKPFALWAAIKVAKGAYTLFCDMDLSTPIFQLDNLLPSVKGGYKVVIGSRGVGRDNFPLYRRMGSIIFMSLRKFFLLAEINDTQCGFKLFRTDIVKNIFPKLEFFRKQQRVKGWNVTSFDVELLHLIKKQGEAIKEVSVEWKDLDLSISKGGGLSRYINESKEMLMQIMRVKINDIKGFYD